MELISGESVISQLQAKDNNITLTDQRVLMVKTSEGAETIQCIPIRSIDSIVTTTISYTWLLIAGAFGMIYNFVQEEFIVGIIVAVFFVILYFATRKTGCFIYSVSGKTEINISTESYTKEQILMIVNDICSAVAALGRS